MKRVLASGLAFIVYVGVAAAADNPDARISIGDIVGAFRVKDITGPNAGEKLCYRCQYGRHPVACVFVREVTPEIVQLIVALEEMVRVNTKQNFKCFVVLLTTDADAGAKKLAEVSKEHGLNHVPLTVFENARGPGVYRISEDAAVTLFQWNEGRFTYNRGFSDARLSDESRKAFLTAASKMTGG